MRIEIKSAEVVQREVPGRGEREGFTAYSQDAYIVTDDERRKFSLRVQDKASAYKPGAYQLGGASLSVDQYGRLELGRVVLEPIKQG